MGNEICLYGVGGAMAGNIFPIEDATIVIGRDVSKCAVIYPPDTAGISNVHCQIKKAYPCVEITDLGSSYGTYYENGVKMQKNTPYKLGNGEAFYIGEKKNKFIVKE